VQKSLPSLEPTLNREAIDLRTRGARGGFRVNRTLDARADAPRETSYRLFPKPKTFQFFASLPRPLPAFEKKERFLVLVRRNH